MGYVAQQLIDGEDVLYEARFHWTYGLVTVFICLFFVGLGVLVHYIQAYFYQMHALLSLIPVVFGLLIALVRIIRRRSTEIVITSRRLIYKTGFVARKTEEIPLPRLEEVNVAQSVVQRLIGCGQVAVRGMGTGSIVLPVIDEPVVFRRALEQGQARAQAASTPPGPFP